MDISYSPYLSVENEVKGFVVNARNITERKKAEEQLEKSQKELKKLTAHLQTVREEDSIAIYRIVQEALNNIKWHSNAKTVNVSLKITKNHLELMIEDDGIGIKEEDLNKSNSFGIIGMKERASFLGGEIEFKNLFNEGTTITVTIPINPESSGTGSSNN